MTGAPFCHLVQTDTFGGMKGLLLGLFTYIGHSTLSLGMIVIRSETDK